MTNITDSFGSLYIPKKAFVLFEESRDKNVYVESYDMDEQGFPSMRTRSACGKQPRWQRHWTLPPK